MNDDPSRSHHITAGPVESGRLDAFLAARIPDLSRSRIKALIADGALSANGETILDPSRAVKPGHTYDLAVPEPAPAEPVAQDIALDILYEDSDLIVLNKPAGLVVHPAPGNPDATLVNALLYHCGDSLAGIGGVKRPGIVHRLDKETSGVMVAAKTETAHAGLVGQFAAHDIERAYGALVWGVPHPHQGRIDGNIGRSHRNRKKMAVLAHGGRSATTHYRLVAPVGTRASRIECRLETGRTHQIRVHMAHAGHPVVADPLYGGRRNRSGLKGVDFLNTELSGGQQALHAFRLGFVHPGTGEKLEFEAPFPPYFNSLIEFLEGI